MRRFRHSDDLVDPAALSSWLGPVDRVERTPLVTPGFSAARHEQLVVRLRDGNERRLHYKHVRLADDWTARRTGDREGREALLLAEPQLAGIWEASACPYVAFATGDGEIGLLLEDLTGYLRPHSNERLAVAEEDGLLGTLATLHAHYWESEALRLPWLTPLSGRFSILGPGAGEELHVMPGHALFRTVQRGWELALARLPMAVRAMLLRPPEETVRAFGHLPRTLLHGDAKIGNCAWLPDGRVALFDWAMMGVGPATLDLGYLCWLLCSSGDGAHGVRGRRHQRIRIRAGEMIVSPLAVCPLRHDDRRVG